MKSSVRSRSGAFDNSDGTTTVLVINGERAAEGERAIQAIREAGYLIADPSTAGESFSLIRSVSPSAIVYVEPSGAAVADDLGEMYVAQARAAKIPVLALIDMEGDSDRLERFDDLALLSADPSEVVFRLGRLLSRQGRSDLGGAIDPNFLAIVVHDLRTPLNAMGLAMQVIEHVISRKDLDLDEDLHCIRANSLQIERMLTQLSDYCRIGMTAEDLRPLPFDPRRLADETLEKWRSKAPQPPPGAILEVDPSCPAEVSLDQGLVGQAIYYALANAAASNQGELPVRLRLSGQPDRWIVSVVVDYPPPTYVEPTTLHPRTFERLNGVAAERRGLDLAVAAWVSQLFSGSARLEVEPGQRTTIVLDWPTRLGPPEE